MGLLKDHQDCVLYHDHDDEDDCTDNCTHDVPHVDRGQRSLKINNTVFNNSMTLLWSSV